MSGLPSLTERDGAWEHHPVVRDGPVPQCHNRSSGGTAEMQTNGRDVQPRAAWEDSEGRVWSIDTTELKAERPHLGDNQMPSPPSFIPM